MIARPAAPSARRRKAAWGAIAGAIAALAALLPLAAAASTLLDNVNGIAIDRQGKVTRFAAMVIDDNGKVERLLDRRDKQPKDIDYREDGRGRTVIPGIVDANGRVMALGLATLALDLSDARSLEEAQVKLLAYAQAHPDQPWIVGFGWDAADWGMAAAPDAAALDAVVPGRPVWLVHRDGSLGLANSAALAAAGIAEGSADPAGGRIGRIAGSRRPSGLLAGNAMRMVEGLLPPPRPKDRDLAFYAAQEMLLARGVTAIADMGTSIDDWMAYRRAGDEGRLRLRILAYADNVATMELIGGTGPTPFLYDDRLRLNGLALTLDGSLATRGALLKAPYADEPASRGLELLNGTQLRNLMSRAAMDDFQVAIAAHGDAAVSEALDAIEELADDYKGDRRWRIEHVQVVSPDDLVRFGRHGVIASMQPGALAGAWRGAEARLGSERLAGVEAWNAVRSSGAPLAFGSGTPARPVDPLGAVAAAIGREDEQGQPFGGWMPQQRVTREQALAAMTAVAAHAGFADGHFGSLARGERADFLVLDADPLLANPAELRAMRVLETWIGGQKVFEVGGRRPADAPGR